MQLIFIFQERKVYILKQETNRVQFKYLLGDKKT